MKLWTFLYKCLLYTSNTYKNVLCIIIFFRVGWLVFCQPMKLKLYLFLHRMGVKKDTKNILVRPFLIVLYFTIANKIFLSSNQDLRRILHRRTVKIILYFSIIFFVIQFILHSSIVFCDISFGKKMFLCPHYVLTY